VNCQVYSPTSEGGVNFRPFILSFPNAKNRHMSVCLSSVVCNKFVTTPHIIFRSLFVVYGYVDVGNFFLVFSLQTHQSKTNTDKDLIMLWRERKEIQKNQSLPLNSLLYQTRAFRNYKTNKSFDFFLIYVKNNVLIRFHFLLDLNYDNLIIN